MVSFNSNKMEYLTISNFINSFGYKSTFPIKLRDISKPYSRMKSVLFDIADRYASN